MSMGMSEEKTVKGYCPLSELTRTIDSR